MMAIKTNHNKLDSVAADHTPIERLTRLKHLDIHLTHIAKHIKFELLSQLTSLDMSHSWAGDSKFS